MEETIKIKGEWGIYSLSPEVQEGHPAIEDLRTIERGKLPEAAAQLLLSKLMEKGIVLNVAHQHNLVPTVGRGVLARLLAGTATPSGRINYIALGTGTPAFSNASVQLNNETFRKIVSDSSYDTNLSYIDCFIASGDVANQTFKEAGAFIDGTTGTATGSAFSLVVQDFVKSGSMYVSLKVTLT